MSRIPDRRWRWIWRLSQRKSEGEKAAAKITVGINGQYLLQTGVDMVKEKIKVITDHGTKPIIVFDGGMFGS